ncbi:hypothetical protein HY404_00525 [Candidatus Microgenomates bacterium]|nr:hypothetical protein [Candidatus Microgenomates bacterium]
MQQHFNKFIGQRLLLVMPDNKGIRSDLANIKDIKVKRKIPDTLIVMVEMSKPKVAIQNEGQQAGKFLLVDISGNIVGQANQTSLPKIMVEKNDQLNSWLIQLVDLLSRSFGTDKISIFRLNGNGLSFQLDGAEIILPTTDKDSQLLVGSLQLVMKRFTMDSKQPVKIDLRFKNPVVTF